MVEKRCRQQTVEQLDKSDDATGMIHKRSFAEIGKLF
jgi:hypothetical protein